ncbi:hypothetical protein [Paludisphaera mucosa]|uniref:Zinc-finger domain-containing protein n=1 Tax=Paludisphaera mucosa TaxID=3030827 RepID=A0ABT6FBJ7_9BACT|nr:hypothetical protein [Paludisphaera mucosa]MDG3004973.1 hypothetical protein [Paludisphaera mucosa]
MSRTIACPEKSDLLAIAAGEVASPPLRSHVDGCLSCRTTVRRLKVEIGCLRFSVAPERWIPSTVLAWRASPRAD